MKFIAQGIQKSYSLKLEIDLDLEPKTYIYQVDLDICKMYTCMSKMNLVGKGIQSYSQKLEVNLYLYIDLDKTL